ncbi:hypothetical protein F2Q69_00055123 [Brassica cretica]|uniref:Uncharacterized protein n=1 Tax=Brassica cretica TaxID=69181 RepID=A0A8S9N923_BRACR|nr:hypothetical protein F2Q69_00055123 [Brassica cretica]
MSLNKLPSYQPPVRRVPLACSKFPRHYQVSFSTVDLIPGSTRRPYGEGIDAIPEKALKTLTLQPCSGRQRTGLISQLYTNRILSQPAQTQQVHYQLRSSDLAWHWDMDIAKWDTDEAIRKEKTTSPFAAFENRRAVEVTRKATPVSTGDADDKTKRRTRRTAVTVTGTGREPNREDRKRGGPARGPREAIDDSPTEQLSDTHTPQRATVPSPPAYGKPKAYLRETLELA